VELEDIQLQSGIDATMVIIFVTQLTDAHNHNYNHNHNHNRKRITTTTTTVSAQTDEIAGGPLPLLSSRNDEHIRSSHRSD
jgi:hypothetical protein